MEYVDLFLTIVSTLGFYGYAFKEIYDGEEGRLAAKFGNILAGGFYIACYHVVIKTNSLLMHFTSQSTSMAFFHAVLQSCIFLSGFVFDGTTLQRLLYAMCYGANERTMSMWWDEKYPCYKLWSFLMELLLAVIGLLIAAIFHNNIHGYVFFFSCAGLLKVGTFILTFKANNNRLYQIRKLRRSRRNDYRQVAVIELKREKALEEMEGLLRMEHDKEMEDTVEGNIRNQVAEYYEDINKIKNWVLELLQIVSCFLCSKFRCP
ncbi:hypothetical protein CRE_06706 [Caenorhabditis remanei]|uniref:Uncharacterized protein n=1 Tax=Caenorhabditis remanei TaxID=31234 RepID=E3M146_CAERE|nr:hypothetical protein CRE_06706 [Caenorhabditis remanei]